MFRLDLSNVSEPRYRRAATILSWFPDVTFDRRSRVATWPARETAATAALRHYGYDVTEH